jgi:LemA protein
MSTTQVISLLLAATLLFWGLGAYNRMVRLRGEISLRYVVVHEQLKSRHDLLVRWLQAMEPWLGNDPGASEALRTCCDQLQQAADHARLRPSAARRVARLRTAEDDLTGARARILASMPAQFHRVLPMATSVVEPDGHGVLSMPVLLEELTAAGGLLTLARQQFNEAVQDYNEAIDQFPTWIIAGLFRFRSAGVI